MKTGRVGAWWEVSCTYNLLQYRFKCSGRWEQNNAGRPQHCRPADAHVRPLRPLRITSIQIFGMSENLEQPRCNTLTQLQQFWAKGCVHEKLSRKVWQAYVVSFRNYLLRFYSWIKWHWKNRRVSLWLVYMFLYREENKHILFLEFECWMTIRYNNCSTQLTETSYLPCITFASHNRASELVKHTEP